MIFHRTEGQHSYASSNAHGTPHLFGKTTPILSMTCGLCHRDPEQHTFSASGPTRCKYTTHRANCPASFTSKCADHIIDGIIASPEISLHESEATDESKDATIRKLTEELQRMKLEPNPGSAVPHTPSQAGGLDTPISNGGSKVSVPPGTTGQTWGQKPPSTPQTMIPSTTPGSTQAQTLDGIQNMVRDHVASNQQFLNSQVSGHGSYAGPTMAQIRQDSGVQSQADLIMNSVKTACPVFGQNLPGSSTPVPGISTLNQGVLHGIPNQLPSHNLQQQLGQLNLQQIGQLGLQNHPQQLQNSLLAGTHPQLHTQQAQQWSNQHPHLNQMHNLSSQIPANLAAAIAQLGPDAAVPILQALQQQTTLTNPIQQAQQSPWASLGNQQPQQLLQGVGLGLHGTGLGLQGALQQGHLNPLHGLQQSVIGNSFGQLPHLQAQQPHQGLLQFANHPEVASQSQRQPLASTPQQGMSMTSMTGVMFIRPTEFSKYCQVEFAKKAKADNCNLVLYVWGFIAQILASRQGSISAMSDPEVAGRLQHLLHVLELCAMQSSSTDFNSPAWLCARNYSDRVFQDLDSGATSWSQIGPKMHPTNMMQAMSAHPKVTIPKQVQDKSGKPQNQPDGSPGLVCPKWSTCEVDEKCQWEVENPGRTCNRPHYCLFCQKKFKQTRKHKEADCRKKTELAGTDTDQPTR